MSTQLRVMWILGIALCVVGCPRDDDDSGDASAAPTKEEPEDPSPPEQVPPRVEPLPQQH